MLGCKGLNDRILTFSFFLSPRVKDEVELKGSGLSCKTSVGVSVLQGLRSTVSTLKLLRVTSI